MKAPRSLTIVGIAALLWNLIGVLSFSAQASIDPAALARTDPDTARIYAAMPGWVWASFALSVFGGLLGAILLLMRRALAVPAYALSLVATVILFGHSFLATAMLALEGWTSTLLPAFIIALCIAQLIYARGVNAKGLLR